MATPYWAYPIYILNQLVGGYPGVLQMLVWLIGAFFVTYPAGSFIRWLLKGKRRMLEASLPKEELTLTQPTRGFPDGGAVIGRLERLLIFMFVMSGELGAVGFLIAAKSIFRFGKLTNQQNRLEAEYIIIGTLMSFSVGLLISHAFQTGMQNMFLL